MSSILAYSFEDSLVTVSVDMPSAKVHVGQFLASVVPGLHNKTYGKWVRRQTNVDKLCVSFEHLSVVLFNVRNKHPTLNAFVSKYVDSETKSFIVNGMTICVVASPNYEEEEAVVVLEEEAHVFEEEAEEAIVVEQFRILKAPSFVPAKQEDQDDIQLPTFHYDDTLSITHLDMTDLNKLVPFVSCVAVKKGLNMIPMNDDGKMHLYTLGTIMKGVIICRICHGGI